MDLICAYIYIYIHLYMCVVYNYLYIYTIWVTWMIDFDNCREYQKCNAMQWTSEHVITNCCITVSPAFLTPQHQCKHGLLAMTKAACDETLYRNVQNIHQAPQIKQAQPYSQHFTTIQAQFWLVYTWLRLRSLAPSVDRPLPLQRSPGKLPWPQRTRDEAEAVRSPKKRIRWLKVLLKTLP